MKDNYSSFQFYMRDNIEWFKAYNIIWGQCDSCSVVFCM